MNGEIILMINSNLTRYQRAKNWCQRHKNTIFYGFTLFILTVYVVLNWNKCISMQFFDDFNGNNILFLCWILMIFLRIFRIKVKDIEVCRNIQDEMLNADLQHSIDERQQLLSQEQQAAMGCNQEGVSSNAQSTN